VPLWPIFWEFWPTFTFLAGFDTFFLEFWPILNGKTQKFKKWSKTGKNI